MAVATSLNQAGLAVGDTFNNLKVSSIYDAAAGRYLWAQADAASVAGFDQVADDAAKAAWVAAAIATPGSVADGHQVQQADTGASYTWEDATSALIETGTVLETIVTTLDPADPATYAPSVRYVVVEGHANPASDKMYAVIDGSLVPATN